MKVLIVCATMSERSFNASMLDTAIATLLAAGHEVRISNLQAMNFDPVTRPEDLSNRKIPRMFDTISNNATRWSRALSPTISRPNWTSFCGATA